jgi:hypothetical protein
LTPVAPRTRHGHESAELSPPAGGASVTSIRIVFPVERRAKVSRPRLWLVSGVVALAGVALPSSVAEAAPPADASCLGVLSSFAGEAGIRDEFAPAPGPLVAGLASQHGDFEYCLGLFLGG